MAAMRPLAEPVTGGPEELAEQAATLWDSRPDRKAPERGPWGHTLAYVVRALARTPEAARRHLTGYPRLIQAVANEVRLAAQRTGSGPVQTA